MAYNGGILYGRYVFECLGCGKLTTVEAGDQIFDCPFCGEKVKPRWDMSDSLRIERVYPFTLTQSGLTDRLNAKLGASSYRLQSVEERYFRARLVRMRASGRFTVLDTKTYTRDRNVYTSRTLNKAAGIFEMWLLPNVSDIGILPTRGYTQYTEQALGGRQIEEGKVTDTRDRIRIERAMNYCLATSLNGEKSDKYFVDYDDATEIYPLLYSERLVLLPRYVVNVKYNDAPKTVNVTALDTSISSRSGPYIVLGQANTNLFSGSVDEEIVLDYSKGPDASAGEIISGVVIGALLGGVKAGGSHSFGGGRAGGGRTGGGGAGRR